MFGVRGAAVGPRDGEELALLTDQFARINTLAVLPDGHLVSGAVFKTIRLWDPGTENELARLEVDTFIQCLAVLIAIEGNSLRLVAGDPLGRLHWMEILD